MTKVIETFNLSKNFGGFCAVKDISLSVNKGEIYGFLGLNGAGKTTTIRMLLGLIRPTDGDVRICGEKILPGGKGPWNSAGSLVEVPFSYPELTVRDNLEIIRRMRGISDRKAVGNIAEKLNITRYLEKKSGHLSLGNAQRLGLAKALIHEPELLILDEPSNGLDPAGILEIRQLLIDLSADLSVTIFVSSHILSEIAKLSTRIGIIHEGKLIKEMDSAEIHNLRQRHLIVGTRDVKKAKEVLEKEGFTVAGTDDETMKLTDEKAIEFPDTVASILVNSGNPPILLHEQEDDLEKVFLNIVGKEGGVNE